MTTNRKCFTVDLHDDDALIARYRAWHAAGAVPAAVTAALRAEDIRELEIYLIGNRMFMVMEQGDRFDPAAKTRRDDANPDIAAWDQLMRTFQKPSPLAPEGTTWLEMERIYALSEQ